MYLQKKTQEFPFPGNELIACTELKVFFINSFVRYHFTWSFQNKSKRLQGYMQKDKSIGPFQHLRFWNLKALLWWAISCGFVLDMSEFLFQDNS